MVYFNGRSRKEGRSRNYDRVGWLRIQTFATEWPKNPKTRGFLHNPRVIHVLVCSSASRPWPRGGQKTQKKLEVSYRTHGLSLFLLQLCQPTLPSHPGPGEAKKKQKKKKFSYRTHGLSIFLLQLCQPTLPRPPWPRGAVGGSVAATPPACPPPPRPPRAGLSSWASASHWASSPPSWVSSPSI
jgi:hypothetical protein